MKLGAQAGALRGIGTHFAEHPQLPRPLIGRGGDAFRICSSSYVKCLELRRFSKQVDSCSKISLSKIVVGWNSGIVVVSVYRARMSPIFARLMYLLLTARFDASRIPLLRLDLRRTIQGRRKEKASYHELRWCVCRPFHGSPKQVRQTHQHNCLLPC